MENNAISRYKKMAVHLLEVQKQQPEKIFLYLEYKPKDENDNEKFFESLKKIQMILKQRSLQHHTHPDLSNQK